MTKIEIIRIKRTQKGFQKRNQPDITKYRPKRNPFFCSTFLKPQLIIFGDPKSRKLASEIASRVALSWLDCCFHTIFYMLNERSYMFEANVSLLHSSFSVNQTFGYFFPCCKLNQQEITLHDLWICCFFQLLFTAFVHATYRMSKQVRLM